MPETFIAPLQESVEVLVGLSGSSICNYFGEAGMKKWSGQLLMYSDIKSSAGVIVVTLIMGPLISHSKFVVIPSSGCHLMICTGSCLEAELKLHPLTYL